MFFTLTTQLLPLFIVTLYPKIGFIMAKLNKIKVVLAERDLNNKWLSEKLGKDPATISKWVTNKSQPSLETLISIANVLKVSVQDLIRQDSTE